MTLEDLDWEQERLRVPERKSWPLHSLYPLSPIVGEAIPGLSEKRPPQKQPTAMCSFLRELRSPRAADGRARYPERAAHYLRQAGVKVPRPGSHTLRHTCVQRLVDAHFSLKEIGDYVGHGSPDSTKIYSKS